MATPSIKLGNGNWGVRQGNLLAYNDENANFKPKPFDASRNSVAYRTNSAGVIVPNVINKPRIDFLDSTSGALLTEPQSTNLVTYSNDANFWTGTNITQISGGLSPKGDLDSYGFFETAVTNIHTYHRDTTTTTLTDVTLSVFVKSINRDVRLEDVISGGGSVSFDLINKTIGTIGGSATNPFIIEYDNGWFRIGFTQNKVNTLTRITVYSLQQGSETTSFLGDVTKGLYIYGMQVEELSYATSPIFTSGATATRIADVVDNCGTVNDFNDSEGVIFLDFNHIKRTYASVEYLFSLGTNSSNAIWLRKESGSDTMTFRIIDSGVSQVTLTGLNILTGVAKIAIKYKNTDFAIWYNGTEIATSTLSVTLPTLSELNLNLFGGNVPNTKYNIVEVYKTALTDAELTTLTT